MEKKKKNSGWFLTLSSETPAKFVKMSKSWGLERAKKGDKFALQVVEKGEKEISLNFIRI